MPDARPRPDFLQFAEQCALHKAGAAVLRDQGDVEMFAQAERHARLLAQIQAWAKPELNPDYKWASPELHSIWEQCKAHVRRLLEQP